ncbi:alanine aminotransferase 2-like [Latimeria chalumnae]|uniref:alanine aminotransferase 2-like n=1 Tax=Latimeria chalumnae TaxID=7897 RepID=UPI0003C197F8|nr:PREDICTED: alanine aminotransferase 2-like [Latimeria chalumnae]|eukprot:XP_005996843.1 PREDICTED: alanine aminotransferase 2-like [Latimeria chalumnae]
MSSKGKIFTWETMSPDVRKLKTGIRGPLADRALEITAELKRGEVKPFKEVISCHMGDTHSLGQKPVTFLRQVIALCTYPELLKDDMFPEDAKSRARRILQECMGGSIGSYNEPAGNMYFRQSVAKYIEERDCGIPADPENILLFPGATGAVLHIFRLLISGEGPTRTGVMVPIPMYPLYNDIIILMNAVEVPYMLEEENNWALNVQELQRALRQARAHCNPRVLCIINPGNPTGAVQSQKCIEEVIRFAAEEKLFLLADEVYQDCVFGEGCKFHSFKKVLFEMGPEYSERVELVSLHSISKGYLGECGLRGGYMELVNIDPHSKQKLYTILRYFSTPLISQISLNILVDPPQLGDPSYETFIEEKQTILETLAENARLMEEVFTMIPGISCNPIQGAIYSFPRIELPDKAIEQAKSLGEDPETFYCMKLLEATGVILVPGHCFNQREEMHHFRMTVLPSPGKLKTLLNNIRKFHQEFLLEFS